MKLQTLFRSQRPVVGMVHLLPLPGSPRFRGPLEEVYVRAVRDAGALAEEGVDGLLLENFGDAPYFPDEVPPITVAAMASLLDRLRRTMPATFPWGVNVLRNDARAAVSIAAACGATFIRVNVHLGLTATDQGLLEGKAHETTRLRALLAPEVVILADARVKHGRSLGSQQVGAEVRDLVERGLADAVLLTGDRTGEPPDLEELEDARRAAGKVAVWAASGITAENAAQYARSVDGFIVGSSLKRGGRVEGPVDRGRVRRLMSVLAGARTGETRGGPGARRARGFSRRKVSARGGSSGRGGG